MKVKICAKAPTVCTTACAPPEQVSTQKRAKNILVVLETVSILQTPERISGKLVSFKPHFKKPVLSTISECTS